MTPAAATAARTATAAPAALARATPPGEEAEPIPTLETPATRSKAPKDALDDACADTKAPKKAPKKVQKANDDQSSSGFDAQDSEPAPPDGVTFIDAVAPNLDVWVTTEEAKESVPPASADTDSTTLETDEDAGAEASVEARGGDVSESPAKTEDDDSRPSTDTSRVDPAGPETAGQGQSDDPKKSS